MKRIAALALGTIAVIAVAASVVVATRSTERGATAPDAALASPVELPDAELRISPAGETTRGAVTRPGVIEVEVAMTQEARERGLQERTGLATGEGMAFLYPEARTGGFWMKDTLIPLRIAFWDETGTITVVLEMEPCRTDPCPIYDPHTTYIGAVEATPATFREARVEPGAKVAIVGVDPGEAT